MPFVPKLYLWFSKTFYHHSLCHLSLFHSVVSSSFQSVQSHDFSNCNTFGNRLYCQICHSFCLFPLNHNFFFFNSSSINGDLTVVTVLFLMGACLLVTGISNFINVHKKFSGCLVAPHYTPRTNKYYLHQQHRNHYKTYRTIY